MFSNYLYTIDILVLPLLDRPTPRGFIEGHDFADDVGI